MDLLTVTGGGNQYLRPDYLTPLPTTLDAKKSPLALLAQTCSQIGADPPATKSLLASITSVSSSMTSSSSSSRASGSGGSESSGEMERSASSSSVTPPHKTVSSGGSGGGGKNDKGNNTKSHNKKAGKNHKSTSSNSPGWIAESKSAVVVSSLNNATPPPPTLIGGRRSRCSSKDDTEETDTTNMSGGAVSKTSSTPSPQKRESPSAPPEKRAPVTPPLPPPSSNKGPTSKDKLNLSGPSSLFPSSSSTFAPFPSPTTIPPYLHSYARLKAAATSAENAFLAMSSASHHNPHPHHHSGPCRDPFCPGCQASAGHHLSSLAASSTSSKCIAGCISCDHVKPPPPPHHPSLSYFPPLLHPSFASSLYSTHHTPTATPYICNWIPAGESYCGKRFSSSEELLQHLRSHTSLTSSSSSSSSCGVDLYGSRTYPTPPLSPASSSSSSSISVMNRYHPYAKTSLPGYQGVGGGLFSPTFPFGGGQFSALAAAAAAAAAAANNPLSPYFPYAHLYGGGRLGGGGGGAGSSNHHNNPMGHHP